MYNNGVSGSRKRYQDDAASYYDERRRLADIRTEKYGFGSPHDDYNRYNTTGYYNSYYRQRGGKRQVQPDWSFPYPKRSNTSQTKPYETRNYGENSSYAFKCNDYTQRSQFSRTYNKQYTTINKKTIDYQQKNKIQYKPSEPKEVSNLNSQTQGNKTHNKEPIKLDTQDLTSGTSAHFRLNNAVFTIINPLFNKRADNTTRINTKINPNIPRYVSDIIRERIRILLHNTTVDTPEEIVALYRNKYPPETDEVLVSIADGTKYITPEQMSTLLTDSDDPHQFLKFNMKTLLTVGLSNLFNNIQKLQSKDNSYRDHQGEDKQTESVLSQAIPQYQKEVIKFIEAELPKILPKFANVITSVLFNDEINKATKSGILSKTKLLTNAKIDILNGKKNCNITCTKTGDDMWKDKAFPKEISATLSPDEADDKLNLPNNTIEISTRKTPEPIKTYSQNVDTEEKSASFDKVNMEIEDKVTVDPVEVTSLTKMNKEPNLSRSANASVLENEIIATEIVSTTQLNVEDVNEVPNIKVTSGTNTKSEITTNPSEKIHSKPPPLTTLLRSLIQDKDNTAPTKIVRDANEASNTIKTDAPSAVTITSGQEESTNMYIKDIKEPYYAKIICHPKIPSRPEMKKFLDQYNNTFIKKHKSIENLLIVGFNNQGDCDKMLLANQTVIDASTIFIRGYKQTAKEIDKCSVDDNTTEPVPQGNSEFVVKVKTEPKEADQLDDILNTDLEDQITNLLLSIKQEQEEEYGV